MEDGTTLRKHPCSNGWKLFSRKKPGVSIEVWRQVKLDRIATLPAWARDCRSIPSLETIEEWMLDGKCETVTGDVVEPDGHGPDGAPSWLLAIGMI